MSMYSRSRLLALGCAGALVLLTACTTDGPTDPSRSPLAGLARTTGMDSTGNVPPPATDLQDGYFRGRVLGASASGAGDDSLETAPRLAQVTVRVYPRVNGDESDPELGPAIATMVTDAEGDFETPVLSGGAYVVTFTPPESSGYRGVWVSAVAHSGSHEFPWWVVLPK
ncbi:MAG TPA: hypothetical protein VFM71_04120 [Gemmatimonadaceae bacterium]|nr:hypothetical protein [Gemmatimonadaceae bacterium]